MGLHDISSKSKLALNCLPIRFESRLVESLRNIAKLARYTTDRYWLNERGRLSEESIGVREVIGGDMWHMHTSAAYVPYGIM